MSATNLERYKFVQDIIVQIKKSSNFPLELTLMRISLRSQCHSKQRNTNTRTAHNSNITAYATTTIKVDIRYEISS